MGGIDAGAGQLGASAVLDAERRLDTLVDLMTELRSIASATDVARQAVRVLAGNHDDLPAFGFFVVVTDQDGSRGIHPAAGTFAPAQVTQAADLAARVAESAQRQESALVREASDGPAVLHAFPLAEEALGQPSMILVISVPPGHAGDATWQGFVDLLVAQLSGVLAGVRELASERLRSRLLTQLDAAKSAFLANVSHELRTPLTLISAPVHDALQEPSLPGPVRERLQLAQYNVSRLTRMVDALLDFSRMEAGRIAPVLSELDVAGLTRALADSFAPVIEQAGLTLRTDVPDLPHPAMIDHDMYERMLLNLLANAVKYTPAGSITVALTDAGDRFRVAVTDTGIGISATNQRRVFARFVQLPPHPDARSPEGAGIGLAMVKQLAELMGGRVSLESTVGVGSTFTLDLPYLPYRPAAGEVADPGVRSITRRDAAAFLKEMSSWRGLSDDTASSASRAFGGQPARHRLRLLIVEDSPDMRAYLSEVLSDEYDIETATDGVDALAKARARRPHVILSDVMMPGIDGLELVREIRRDADLQLIPVLLLSARAGDQAITEGMDGGADDYIEKPFSLAELRSRLASNAALALTRSSDAAWRRAVVGSLQTALLIAEPGGLVTEMNERFTDLLGWSMQDGPFQPPYPWWPDPVEDPEDFRRVSEAHHGIVEDQPMVGEFKLRRRDGRTVWASYWGTLVTSVEHGRTAIIKSIRDVTREHDSLTRRQAASRVAAGFAAAEDLDHLLADAVRGFGVLFDGRAHLRLRGEARLAGHRDLYDTVFTDEGPRALSELPEPVREMLDSDDDAFTPMTSTPESGILVRNDSPTLVRCVTWVQFLEPREVPTDEFIVGDLLGRALDIAADRILAAEVFARREENLGQAVESHRFVGQAIGILVERYKLTPSDAFDRLREASQRRNIKLRELARRVLETGADPEDA